jgi:hypothetical protein
LIGNIPPVRAFRVAFVVGHWIFRLQSGELPPN